MNGFNVHDVEPHDRLWLQSNMAALNIGNSPTFEPRGERPAADEFRGEHGPRAWGRGSRGPCAIACVNVTLGGEAPAG
eukprot:873919-Alexandrium_andersonii.AAC.1